MLCRTPKNAFRNHQDVKHSTFFGLSRSLVMVWAFCLVTFLGLNSSAKADEPFAAFITRLRETKHFDVAEFYLDQMEKSDLLTPDQKKQIPFRRAEIFYEKTQNQRSADAVESWEKAVQLAEEFAGSATDIDQKMDAVNLIVRAKTILIKTQLNQAETTLEEVGAKPAVAESIRKQLEHLKSVYSKAAEWLRADLKEARVSKDPQRRATFSANTQRFLLMLYSALETELKAAQTLDPASNEFKTSVKNIATEAAGLRKKYTRSAPFEMLFQLLQVRALAADGKTDEAGPLLDDILLLNSQQYQNVQRLAVLEGMKIWFQKDPPLIELAIQKLEKVTDSIREDEWSDEKIQSIFLALAKAHHARVTATAALERPSSDQRTAANFSSNRSEKLLRELAKVDSVVGDEAKELMSQWDLRGPAESVKDVTLFADARELGFNALNEAREFQNQLSTLGSTAEAQQQRTMIETQMTDAANRALAWFNRALELADSASNPTNRADLNLTRVYQTQCYWMKKQYLEASLIGEFLLERFPNEIGTPEGASLAAQSINQMIVDGKKNQEDVSYELQRLKSVCQQVIRKWPERQEAGVVAYLLVTAAIEQGDLPGAVAAVNQLSADNPKRGNAALLVGLSHVNKLRQMQQQGDVPAETETEMLQQAQQFLSSAFESQSTEPSVLYFYGVSQLAQMYNDQQKFQATIQLVESEPANAIQRIQDNDPLVAASDLQVNLIQSDLLAHLGHMAETGDASGAAERGAQLLQLLNDKLATNPRQEPIIQGFYALTLKKLKEQFQAAQDPQKLNALAQATISIFQPVSQSSQDWKLLYSIGDSLADLRERVSDKGIQKQLNNVARASFEKAAAAAKNSNDPKIQVYRTEFELGAASALRADGKFAEAETKLKKALEGQTTPNVKLQIELAQLYLAWGEDTKDTAKLATAINGGLPDSQRKKQMWGWQKLSQALLGRETMKELFYQAFYGLNRSKKVYTDISKKTNVAKSALKDIKGQANRDSTLGGPAWQAKLNTLTKQLQEQVGEQPNGLPGLK